MTDLNLIIRRYSLNSQHGDVLGILRMLTALISET